jgi:hypothetical protein
VSSEFDITFEWNGENDKNSIFFEIDKNRGDLNKLYPRIESHFGHGVITINPPFTLRTSPGVNLMTINPPNWIIPNVTVMTGVIETDNLRRNFTFNLKIQIPNIKITIPAGYPLAAFIPIPRYYSDEFNLDFAENLFNKQIVDEEIKAGEDAEEYSVNVEQTLKNSVGKHYMQGKDVYGNMFKNHQKHKS